MRITTGGEGPTVRDSTVEKFAELSYSPVLRLPWGCQCSVHLHGVCSRSKCLNSLILFLLWFSISVQKCKAWAEQVNHSSADSWYECSRSFNGQMFQGTFWKHFRMVISLHMAGMSMIISFRYLNSRYSIFKRICARSCCVIFWEVVGTMWVITVKLFCQINKFSKAYLLLG
jgi:hypothetical protein